MVGLPEYLLYAFQGMLGDRAILVPRGYGLGLLADGGV